MLSNERCDEIRLAEVEREIRASQARQQADNAPQYQFPNRRTGPTKPAVFDDVGTATGRLSSTNPNLQNIPIKTELGREIRAAFIARPEHCALQARIRELEQALEDVNHACKGILYR